MTIRHTILDALAGGALTVTELAAKCGVDAADKPFQKALSNLRSAKQITRLGRGGEATVTLTGRKQKAAKTATQRRKAKKSKRRAAPPQRRTPRTPAPKVEDDDLLPTLTSDKRLVIIDQGVVERIYTVEQTLQIATLALGNFEPG